MATIIRLQRRGAPHRPFWRIVVTDSRKPGGCIEQLGTYNNVVKPPAVTLDRDRASLWLSRGAAPTVAVKKILAAQGVTAPSGRGSAVSS